MLAARLGKLEIRSTKPLTRSATYVYTGTAVLRLGNLGTLASKPVMEAVLLLRKADGSAAGGH